MRRIWGSSKPGSERGTSRGEDGGTEPVGASGRTTSRAGGALGIWEQERERGTSERGGGEGQTRLTGSAMTFGPAC
jgi:hypothetical protein